MRLFFLLVFLLYSLDGISYGGSRKQQIDEINSNSTSNLILNPTSDVIFDNLNATTVPYLDGSKAIKSSSVTPTELGYLSGVSSSIQTQLNAKVDDSTTITTTSPLFIDGIGSADLSTNRTLSIQQSSSSLSGFLSSTDWTTFNNKFDSPLTTKGDLLSRDASTHVRLGVGSNGQILSADSAEASGLKWINPPATSPLTTKGDIYTYDTNNQRLPVGTDGQLLKANSATATGLEWFTPSYSTISGLTDNCVIRADGTSNVQCGGYFIDDSGNLLEVDGLSFSASLDSDLLFDIGASTTKASKPFPVLTEAQETTLEGNVPPNASFIVNNDTKKLKMFNSTSGFFEEIGGSGAGAETVAYFETFEEATDDFVAYDDGAVSVPDNGIDGATSITCDQSSSSLLFGSGNLLISKGASNLQGEGCSKTISIEQGFYYSPVEISFEIDSSDADYLDEYFGFYLYDVTNSALIRFAGEEIYAGVKTYKAFANLKDTASLRLIFHVKTNTLTAIDLRIDNLAIKKNNLSYAIGSEVYIEASSNDTDSILLDSEDIPFKTIASNYNGAWSNAGNTGLNTADAFTAPFSAYYQVEGMILHTTVDTVVLQCYINGIAGKALNEKTLDGSNERIPFSDIIFLNKGDILTFRTNKTISLQASAPNHWIKIKNISPQIQEQNISTLATFHAYRNSALNHVNQNTYTELPMDTVVDDSLGGWNSGATRYDVKKSGKYTIINGGSFAGIADTNACICNTYKNGVAFIGGTSDNVGANGSCSSRSVATNVELVKGDYIELYCYQSDSVSEAYLVGGQFSSFMSISEIANPNISINTEKIFVSGAGNGGTSLTANVTDIDFTETRDTYGSWNGSVFTANRAMFCDVTGSIQFSAGVTVEIRAYVNNASDGIAGYLNSSTTLYPFNYKRHLNKGDTLSFRSSNTATLSTSATRHKIEIVCE